MPAAAWAVLGDFFGAVFPVTRAAVGVSTAWALHNNLLSKFTVTALSSMVRIDRAVLGSPYLAFQSDRRAVRGVAPILPITLDHVFCCVLP